MPKLDGLFFFYTIYQLSAEWLERAFEEVLDVVRGIARDKALGPDSYSMAFFQSCWDIMREDLMNLFLKFNSLMKFVKSSNATLITLIPKKLGDVEMKDF